MKVLIRFKDKEKEMLELDAYNYFYKPYFLIVNLTGKRHVEIPILDIQWFVVMRDR